MRSATLADIPAIRGLLAEAFENDPLFTWIFPDDEHRLNATAAWLGLFAEAYASGGGRIDLIERDGAIAAVALWRFPGVEPSIPLPTVPGLVAAFVGTERMTAILGGLGEMAEGHSEVYAFLHLLAVSPRFQRQGLGKLVIAPGIEAAMSAGINAELATMNPVNVAFYRSLGFEVTQKLTLKPDGPPRGCSVCRRLPSSTEGDATSRWRWCTTRRH